MPLPLRTRKLATGLGALAASCALVIIGVTSVAQSAPPARSRHRVVVMVWDGLRPTAISEHLTPVLDRLRREGVEFTDHHSTFPTLTMINAASLATGAYPDRTGFFGNSIYAPGASGTDATGEEIAFHKPVFVQDHGTLAALDRHRGNRLLQVETLFEGAQRAGLKTVAVGKSGPAFLQDYRRGGAILDENHVWPRSVAESLLAAQVPLPLRSGVAYPDQRLALPDDNGDPTARGTAPKLRDDAVADPTVGTESLNKASNRYLMRQFLDHLLPQTMPDLSVVWLRDPDSTQHTYGPGAPAVQDALRSQDALLGELLAKLKALGIAASTDVIVVSDHGHSTVAGPAQWFPPRGISNGAPGSIDTHGGYSVSGEVRLAELLRRADPVLEAYDAYGCLLGPALSGTKLDGQPLAPVQTDADGSVCGKAGTRYTSAAPRVPPPALLGPRSVVIASNDGSEYLYLPQRDPDTLARVVRVLQAREQFGAIFVSQLRYPELPAGTLPMSAVRLDTGDERSPDAIVSYAWDGEAVVHGAAGTAFAAQYGDRGAHGSFGPRDVRNTLVAYGPGFRRAFRNPLPSGNVDLAPTIAALLGIDLRADGRVLREALARGAPASAQDYRSEALLLEAERAAEGLVLCYATDLDCRDTRAGHVGYRARVVGKSLTLGGSTWRYYDYADVQR